MPFQRCDLVRAWRVLAFAKGSSCGFKQFEMACGSLRRVLQKNNSAISVRSDPPDLDVAPLHGRTQTLTSERFFTRLLFCCELISEVGEWDMGLRR
eukprot:8442411-Alexandrium_andersonii.AAC.3